MNGVNRLSIGVQSFDFQSLETLGRIHSGDEAEAAFRMARAAGFENISLDLMFGIPGQTLDMLDADLDRVLKLGPEHISIYNLMVEEGTPLADRIASHPESHQLSGIVGQASLYSESLCLSHSQGSTRSRIREARPAMEKKQFACDRQLAPLDEKLEREMYDRIRARLKEAGFVHYEISNFAKPGFECRHNLLYWTGGEYIGCGPAAHSHWNGTRWANVADLNDYCVNGPRREFAETLDPDAKERETLVMGLRLLAGVEVSSAVWKEKQAAMQWLEKEGLLEIEPPSPKAAACRDGRRVRLSENALFVSDTVFTELV